MEIPPTENVGGAERGEVVDVLKRKWEEYLANHGHPILNEIREIIKLFPGSTSLDVARWASLSEEDACIFLQVLATQGRITFEQHFNAQTFDDCSQHWYSD
ncbi:MAG: hypothetical protein ACTSU5_03645 [Promethearchaeota archaeon]